MWEAKARPGFEEDLLEWVRTEGVADLGESVRTEVFTAPGRVVAIVVGQAVPRALPEPPAGLVARPPHAWPFTRVMSGAREPGR